MRIYVVKYCMREDARVTLQLDQTYKDPGEAIQASIDLEADPDVYTSWIEEVYQ